MLRDPTTILRRVLVNELDPVACSTLRPGRDSSPSRLSATTLLPEPGPPSTITTVLVFSSPAQLDSLLDDSECDLLLVQENELLAVLDLVGDVVE